MSWFSETLWNTVNNTVKIKHLLNDFFQKIELICCTHIAELYGTSWVVQQLTHLRFYLSLKTCNTDIARLCVTLKKYWSTELTSS